MEVNVTERIDIHVVKSWIHRRPRDAHKGTFGRVLLIAGSTGMTGASVLSGLGALRSGAGLVYISAPKENFQVIETLVPEAILLDWDETYAQLTHGFTLSHRNLSFDAVLIGPGIGLSDLARRKLKTVLLSYDGPLVIDADGLNLLAMNKELRALCQEYPGDIVLTPHVGEAHRLLAAAGSKWNPDRNYSAFDLAWRYRKIVLLKGQGTLICRTVNGFEGSSLSEGLIDLSENETGNPGMATAGSGDVLSGVITSFAGQGMPLWDAARCGAYIHGAAGDLAARKIGEYGMTAGDIARMLPYAIKPFEEE